MPSHNQRGNWYFANFQTCLDKYKAISQTETGTTMDVSIQKAGNGTFYEFMVSVDDTEAEIK